MKSIWNLLGEWDVLFLINMVGVLVGKSSSFGGVGVKMTGWPCLFGALVVVGALFYYLILVDGKSLFLRGANKKDLLE